MGSDKEIIKGNYKFIINDYRVRVYQFTEFRTAYRGETAVDWLCCSEGWIFNNNQWNEIVNCGWKPGRVAKTVDDIINYYIEE